MRILCPNGHLGFAPIKTASFRTGLDLRHPEFPSPKTLDYLSSPSLRAKRSNPGAAKKDWIASSLRSSQ
jgi:hypothetical protein